MKVDVVTDQQAAPADAVLVLPFFEGDTASALPALGERQREDVSAALARGAKLHRLYETTLLYASSGGQDAILIGAGKRDEIDPLTVRRIAAAATRFATGRGYTCLTFTDVTDVQAFDFASAVIDGVAAGAYNLGIRKSGERGDRRVDEVTILAAGPRQEDVQAGANVGTIVAESRDIARDLVNRPPNEISPPALAQRARELSEQYGLACDVLGREAMEKLGMGSFLGVAAGSRQPPQLIAMRYGDESAPIRLALVGKGLTFDSGGLSLKTAEGMETMKTDMSGAAAVVAGMVAVARLAPAGVTVTGYVGATENMPDGNAMRPGDVLTAMNGKTIEVLNTDAEGRLVLADVLSYAAREGATHIVDFATLTGAANVALGNAASLATGKPMEWVNEVVEAGNRGLDRAWPMPQYREYRQAMDSEVADLKNTGGRGGGALNAAAFLSEFVDGVPWTHLDIAGTAFSRESKPYGPGGATGVGVGAIVSLVRALSQAEHA